MERTHAGTPASLLNCITTQDRFWARPNWRKPLNTTIREPSGIPQPRHSWRVSSHQKPKLSRWLSDVLDILLEIVQSAASYVDECVADSPPDHATSLLLKTVRTRTSKSTAKLAHCTASSKREERLRIKQATQPKRPTR